MSKKANRLRARLSIERDRAERAEARLRLELRRLADRDRAQDARENALRDRERQLGRSLAMRMHVQERFDRAYGERYGLYVELSPEVFRHEFYTLGPPSQLQSATYYAARKGHEVGEQVKEVILRCLSGELKDFARAL